MSAMANASDGDSPGAVRPTVLAKVRAKHMRSHAVITLDDEENLISSLVPASNFFHCAYALVLDTSRPIYARLLGLTLSIAVVCVQLLVLMAAYRATMVGSCLDNLDCVARGAFAASRRGSATAVNSATVPIRASGRRAARARRRRSGWQTSRRRS